MQVWDNMMRFKELLGKELLDANLITVADLYDWLNAKKVQLLALDSLVTHFVA